MGFFGAAANVGWHCWLAQQCLLSEAVKRRSMGPRPVLSFTGRGPMLRVMSNPSHREESSVFEFAGLASEVNVSSSSATRSLLAREKRLATSSSLAGPLIETNIDCKAAA